MGMSIMWGKEGWCGDGENGLVKKGGPDVMASSPPPGSRRSWEVVAWYAETKGQSDVGDS